MRQSLHGLRQVQILSFLKVGERDPVLDGSEVRRERWS